MVSSKINHIVKKIKTKILEIYNGPIKFLKDGFTTTCGIPAVKVPAGHILQKRVSLVISGPTITKIIRKPYFVKKR